LQKFNPSVRLHGSIHLRAESIVREQALRKGCWPAFQPEQACFRSKKDENLSQYSSKSFPDKQISAASFFFSLTRLPQSGKLGKSGVVVESFTGGRGELSPLWRNILRKRAQGRNWFCLRPGDNSFTEWQSFRIFLSGRGERR